MKKKYVNGSNMLLKLNSKAVGHCTSHTVTLNAETKEHAVKPVAAEKITAALWKGKTISGLSASISADGLMFYEETEHGYAACAAMLVAGQSVEVECFERESDAKPYLKGNFVITSLDNSNPAGDDATYTISLENDGAVVFDATGLTTLTEGE